MLVELARRLARVAADEHLRSVLQRRPGVRSAAPAATCSSARRRGARCASGRRRSPSRRRSSALRRPLQPRAARRAARGGGRPRRATSASCSTACARRARAGLIAARARRARGRAREPRARRARDVQGRGDAAAQRTGEARRPAVVRRPRGARRDPGRCERARSTPTGSSCSRASEELAADLSGIADAVERNEEEKDISLRELSRALKRASDRTRPPRTASCASGGSSGCSATSAPPFPSSSHTAYMRRLSPLEATYTKERATEVCLRDARGARLRSERAAEHQARPRRPAAEVAARVRDRERPAEGRAPDHPRAGRPARLPGVPARGRARAALRRLRSGAAVHRSGASRATTR